MLFRISTKDFEELGLNLAGFEDRQNFEAVIVLAQYDMDNGNPLFAV